MPRRCGYEKTNVYTLCDGVDILVIGLGNDEKNYSNQTVIYFGFFFLKHIKLPSKKNYISSSVCTSKSLLISAGIVVLPNLSTFRVIVNSYIMFTPSIKLNFVNKKYEAIKPRIFVIKIFFHNLILVDNPYYRYFLYRLFLYPIEHNVVLYKKFPVFILNG